MSLGNKGTSTEPTIRTLIHEHPAPKLESLSLCYYETFYSWDLLLDVLKERHDYSHGLRELVLQSCPIGEDEDVLKIEEMAEVR